MFMAIDDYSLSFSLIFVSHCFPFAVAEFSFAHQSKNPLTLDELILQVPPTTSDANVEEINYWNRNLKNKNKIKRLINQKKAEGKLSLKDT